LGTGLLYFPGGDGNGRFEISEPEPCHQDIVLLIHELSEESDRGAVLIGVAVAEDLLGRIILSYFRDSDEGQRLLHSSGALGAFSAKIKLAQALGLVDRNEAKALEIIAKIRNRFAHILAVSFTDQSVRDLCGNLTYANGLASCSRTSRDVFLENCLLLLLEMSDRPSAISAMKSSVAIGIRRMYRPFLNGSED
jgi:DNA-binding MltR family transcriptional regulator